ncbi:MAG: hypothetical protein COB61_004210 [Thiotrichales bacterium]|nr:hypothetical protein [Thiotrichales bacterium]
MAQDNKDPIKFSEKLVYGLVSLVLGSLILWVGSRIDQQSEDWRKQSIEIALINQSITNLKAQLSQFTKKPRFSRQDFYIEMRPYDKRLHQLEATAQNPIRP